MTGMSGESRKGIGGGAAGGLQESSGGNRSRTAVAMRRHALSGGSHSLQDKIQTPVQEARGPL